MAGDFVADGLSISSEILLLTDSRSITPSCAKLTGAKSCRQSGEISVNAPVASSATAHKRALRTLSSPLRPTPATCTSKKWIR